MNNDEEIEKKLTPKDKVLLYIKRLGLVLAFNIVVSGILMGSSHLMFQTGLTKECFANAMLGIGLVYLLGHFALFQSDIYIHQDSVKRAFQNPKISERMSFRKGAGGFSKTEALLAAVSYAAVTIRIAYLIVIH